MASFDTNRHLSMIVCANWLRHTRETTVLKLEPEVDSCGNAPVLVTYIRLRHALVIITRLWRA